MSVQLSGGGGRYPVPGLGRGGTPSQVWVGGYPVPGLGSPPPPPIAQSSIASTCYAAGGVPLAFTQENFLVSSNLFVLLFEYFTCQIQLHRKVINHLQFSRKLHGLTMQVSLYHCSLVNVIEIYTFPSVI